MLDQLFEHNTWANLRILEACEALTDEQLDKETPGTYGTIRKTLLHIAGAQERYAWRLDNSWESPGVNESQEPTFQDLRKSFEASGEKLQQLSKTVGARDFIEATMIDGKKYRTDAFVVLVQSIHHGNDHRTQIATLMSVQGLEPPILDSWTHGGERGQIVAVDEAT